MRRTISIACCFTTAILAQRPARPARPIPANLPENNPFIADADVEAGRKLYTGRCGHCHGLAGEGGRGAVLDSGHLRHGGSDRELFIVIRSGIPNSEMPPTFGASDADVWRMAAFLRQLGHDGSSEPVTGDAGAGAIVYRKAGCAQCHTIDGQGGFLGPDLMDIGARRAVRHLRESVVDPGKDIPLDFRTVAVATRSGASIRGIHLNEDEYSVHLRDASGNPRSFLKNELKSVELPRQSLMPAYASLPAGDLENLVAYLHAQRREIVWTFDRLENIGGYKTTILGQPKIVDSPLGKAVEFNGVDDALIIGNHPLAGAAAFTIEAIFRPDGGQREQRWFHLNEQNPRTGADTEGRMLFEIRVAGDQWFLDSYNHSGNAGKALMNRQALHPLGVWHHVATVYDGKELRNYVDGVQEGAAQVSLAPHGPGHTSVGVRINKVFYFKGAVRQARFTREALTPAEFLKAPPKH
jgi:putative heme-binding domain-containing protein